MIFNIIITIVLFIALNVAMHNIIIGIRIKAYELIVLSVIETILIGVLFGLASSSILFTFGVL